MAKLTPGELNALDNMVRQSIDKSWRNADSSKTWGNDLLTQHYMDRLEEKFTWIEDWAVFKKRNRHEEIEVSELKASTMDVKIQHWAQGLRVSVYDAELRPDSQLLQRAGQLGVEAALLPTRMLVDFIRDGESTKTWDGVNYFANTHPRGGTTYDNLLSGDLSKDTLVTALVTMRRFPDDLGEPMNIMGNTLVIPPELEYEAKELVHNTLSSEQYYNKENVLNGVIKNIYTDARFTVSEDDDWYLFATSEPVKPFLHLRLKGFSPVKITSKIDAKDENVLFTKQYEWYAEVDEAVTPTFPFLGLKVVGV